jgi:thioredoxin-related protein
MSGQRRIGLKLFLLAVAAVAVIGVQLWMNGTAQKYLARYLPAKYQPTQVSPETAGVIDEPLKQALAKGKVAVIKFNLVNCGICERMSRDVFTKPEWAKFAARKLEVTEFLMPTTITSEQPELVKRIQLLDSYAKASGAQQGFPFIAVLGKDGSLLGARAGYHNGGAPAYIKWMEGLIANDKSSPRQLPETPVTESKAPAPAPPAVPANASIPGPATNAVVKASLEIVVKGVSGAGANKVVLLGIGERNFPLFSGDKKRVQFNNASVLVECREVGEKEVVVQVEGEDKERRLSLRLE